MHKWSQRLSASKRNMRFALGESVLQTPELQNTPNTSFLTHSTGSFVYVLTCPHWDGVYSICHTTIHVAETQWKSSLSIREMKRRALFCRIGLKRPFYSLSCVSRGHFRHRGRSRGSKPPQPASHQKNYLEQPWIASHGAYCCKSGTSPKPSVVMKRTE